MSISKSGTGRPATPPQPGQQAERSDNRSMGQPEQEARGSRFSRGVDRLFRRSSESSSSRSSNDSQASMGAATPARSPRAARASSASQDPHLRSIFYSDAEKDSLKSRMLDDAVDKMCKVLGQFGQLQQTDSNHAARIEEMAQKAIATPKHRAASPRKVAPQGYHSSLLVLALTGMKNVMPQQANVLTGARVVPSQYYERYTEVAALALRKMEAAANENGKRLHLRPMFEEIVLLAEAAQHTRASTGNQDETVARLHALGTAIAEHIQNQPPLPPRTDDSVRARSSFAPENMLHPAPWVFDQQPLPTRSTAFAEAVRVVRNAAEKSEQSIALRTLSVAQAVIRAATAYVEDVERFGKPALQADAEELTRILNPVRLQQSSLHPQIRADFQGALKAIGIQIASSSSDFDRQDEELLLQSPRRRLFMAADELLPEPDDGVPSTPFRPARIMRLRSPGEFLADPRIAATGTPPGTAQLVAPHLGDQVADANRINDSAKKAREVLQMRP